MQNPLPTDSIVPALLPDHPTQRPTSHPAYSDHQLGRVRTPNCHPDHREDKYGFGNVREKHNELGGSAGNFWVFQPRDVSGADPCDVQRSWRCEHRCSLLPDN